MNARDTYGYIDMNGKEVLPCRYFSLTDFNKDGNCTVAMLKYEKASSYGEKYYHQYYYGIYTYSGQAITTPQWRTMGSSKNKGWSHTDYSASWQDDYCQIDEATFSSGRMKVQDAKGKWGFINEQGTVLGAVKWYSVGDFSDGMAMVCEEITTGTGWSSSTSYKYGFINEQGQTIGEVRWDAVDPFSNGYAAVQENGYWGFINKNNELVIPCQYTEVASFNKDGTCDVKTKNGTWQVINTNGEVSFF